MDLTNIEFYNTPEGDVMVKQVGQPVKVLQQSDRELVQAILSLINERYPEAFRALADLYSRSSMNNAFYEFKMVHRFCRCNFGEYDNQRLDVDIDGFFQFEEVRCPLRGTDDCKYHGVICCPRVNNNLTEREQEVLQLIASGMTNEDIADRLSISVFTVIRHRNNMRAKLQARNTAQLITYYNNINHGTQTK